MEAAVWGVGPSVPAMSWPWHVLWPWAGLSKEVLMAFVLVELAAEPPDA